MFKSEDLDILDFYVKIVHLAGFETDHYQAKVDWYWRQNELEHYNLNVRNPREIFVSRARFGGDIDLTTVLGLCEVSCLVIKSSINMGREFGLGKVLTGQSGFF